LYQIAPSPVTRICSFTQEPAIPSPLLQNLDFCTKLDVYRGRKKTHTQKKKYSAKFSKNPTEREEEEALGQNQTGVCSREIQERRTLAKTFSFSRNPFEKDSGNYFEKEKTEKKTLEIWRSPSNCQIKRKRKYEEERSERRRKICNYLVRNRNVVKILDEIKMKQNIYTFVSSIITLSMSKCSQNVIKMSSK
jgi:hypothetical protein